MTKKKLEWMDETYHKEFYGVSSKKLATTKRTRFYHFFPKKSLKDHKSINSCQRFPKRVNIPSPNS